MPDFLRRQSDVEFINGIRSRRKIRLITSVFLLLFGLACLLFVFVSGTDIYRRGLDARGAAVEVLQPGEISTKIAADLVFVTGVRVGYSIAFALGLGIASIAVAIDLSRSKRRDRLLVQYFDLSQQRKVDV